MIITAIIIMVFFIGVWAGSFLCRGGGMKPKKLVFKETIDLMGNKRLFAKTPFKTGYSIIFKTVNKENFIELWHVTAYPREFLGYCGTESEAIQKAQAHFDKLVLSC